MMQLVPYVSCEMDTDEETPSKYSDYSETNLRAPEKKQY